MRVRRLPIREPFAFYGAVQRHFPAGFLLESAPPPSRLAEYTFMGFGPQKVFRLRGGRLYVDVDAASDDARRGTVEVEVERPLDFLRQTLERHRVRVPKARGIKYLGGLVGYLGYDLVRHLERVPGPASPSPFPEFELGLYLDGVVFDHRAGQAFYFHRTPGPDRGEELLALSREAEEPEPLACGALRADVNEAEFCEAVRRAKGYIRDGEAYQIVLSRQLRGRVRGDPLSAYARLRRLNPSPYMYVLRFGGRRIIGSSPEMLVAVQDGRVVTYPIAGTRPLGHTTSERERYAQELLADEKERAEHVMLVDLARNDVGRVASSGSVRVPHFCEVERFSHVQHLVSRVEGELREGSDALDAFAAVFPAGTVSGAPKVRAMELIAELEPSARGPYAGAVGYFSCNGNSDTAIAIRTAFFTENEVQLQAGAGIVADSLPQREFLETEHKLAALRQVLLPAFEEGGGP